MKQIALFLLIFASQTVYADIQSDSDKLFDWAETEYPKYFSTACVTSKTYEQWYYRYYPLTKNYLAVNTTDLDVHVLGEIFGGQVRVDTLQALLSSEQFSETNNNCHTGIADSDDVLDITGKWEITSNYDYNCPAPYDGANIQNYKFYINIETENTMTKLKYTLGDYVYLQGSLAGNSLSYLDTDNSDYQTESGTINFTSNSFTGSGIIIVAVPGAPTCNGTATHTGTRL